jgi:flavin-dependent dehydrogenase
MVQKRDVIIIGAGVAGSSLAVRLATLGWNVALLEREQFPRHKVCGEFLSPEAQVSLKNLGLYQTVAALSPAVIERARLVSPKGITVGANLPGQGWGISRFALDAALVEAAQQAGVELQTGFTVTAIKPHNHHGFGVAFQSKETPAELQGRAVIAACGRHTRPGLPPPGKSKPQPAFLGLKCHYQAIAMPPQVELFFFPGGYAGVAPVEDKLTNVCLLTTPAAFAKAGKDILTMIEQVSHWNPALGRRLSGGRPLPGTAMAVAPVDTGRTASPWAGVACVGDTAVMLPPLCGEGMASALRSAELCAALAHDFLQGKLSLEAWEASYRSAWHSTFNRPLRLARFLQVGLNTPLLSDVLLGVGSLLPPLADLLLQATRGRRQLVKMDDGQAATRRNRRLASLQNNRHP